METNEIAIVYLAFTQSSGGKRRPVIVIDDFSKDLLCYPVTTKYAEKSTRIRKNYLEIVDWQAANLNKPSWIDVGTMYRLDKTLQMKIKKNWQAFSGRYLATRHVYPRTRVRNAIGNDSASD